MKDRSKLLTEQRLPASLKLDSMPIGKIVALMNRQDRVAVDAVAKQRANVARAIKLVVTAFKRGGRLIYAGAGTSGRLGVLDAAECPPTFRTDPAMVQGLIAGGKNSMFRAKEGAEDSPKLGAADVDRLNVGRADVVMGIASGGTTPYVLGAVKRARSRGAKTVFLTCVKPFPGEPKADVVIRPLTGPEVLTGSTRLKAGTATKLILNQTTTISMIQLGKCYENLMVDLRATNQKLWDRGARIIQTLTDLDRGHALKLLREADGHVKVAIVMQRRGVNPDQARRLLDRAGGHLRIALSTARR